VIRLNAAVAIVDVDLARKIVPYDGVGAQRTFGRFANNGNGGDATGHQTETVVNHRIVRDQTVMDAPEGDSPAGAGDDDVVRNRHVRPVLVEGVDALQISWK
jgi:hypothetical protein